MFSIVDALCVYVWLLIVSCNCFQLKDKCPNLAEVCQVALKYLQESIAGNDQVHRLIGRLFTHFFPVDSTNCSTDDCCWFLHFANNQSQWVLSEIARPKSNQELCQNVDALSIHIFKLYLCHILGEQNGDSTSSCNPLAFYNDRVSFIMYMQTYFTCTWS